MQGMRVYVHAALPLAVLLLSQSRARPDERLDGGNLSAVDRCARSIRALSGALVSGAREPEADDRSPCLRGWREPRSDVDPRQGPGDGEGDRAERLGLSEAPRRPRVRDRNA